MRHCPASLQCEMSASTSTITLSARQNGIIVTVNGTVIAPFAAPGEPNWTYQQALNAIVFTPNTDAPKNGAQITVQYPIGCK